MSADKVCVRPTSPGYMLTSCVRVVLIRLYYLNNSRLGQQMAEMPIEPRLAKCLLASLSDTNCNTNVSQDHIPTSGSGATVKHTNDHEEKVRGCTEEMLSIAAMCSVDYPFISLKAKASDERKQQRLGLY